MFREGVRRIEGCAALGLLLIVGGDAAAPHLCLTVGSEFMLTPLKSVRERLATEVGAAIWLIQRKSRELIDWSERHVDGGGSFQILIRKRVIEFVNKLTRIQVLRNVDC